MTTRFAPMPGWLPEGKRAAVCFSVDDVHPGTSKDPYEAGGDLGAGALRHLVGLLEDHEALRATLFVTADWRCISPVPTRRFLAAIPWVRDRVYLAPLRPRGSMRVSSHPAFVEYLRTLPRTEIAFHGLHHASRGLTIPAEFRTLAERRCFRRLMESRSIFAEAGLETVTGLCPPGWEAPPHLLSALCRSGFTFLASARDLVTPVDAEARANQSGLRGVSMIRPEPIADGRLLHFTVNFQATSDDDRALAILEAGGLLHIKAHIIESALGYRALDALNERYRERLGRLFGQLKARFGESLWWTAMGDITERWARHAR